MNILIPDSWLREHLKTKATPKQIQTDVSLCGPTVERINTVEEENVYDIEVTTNRVDCMSVRGFAQEAAAILPEFGLTATLSPLKLPEIECQTPLGMTITNDPKLCHRIVAVKLSNVNIGPSPEWLTKRLELVGQRPLNNAIDITNYVMWELGHPIHVFDFNRLKRNTIIVREAKKGETLTTLDGVHRTLTGGEVIFDDGTGTIVDLPGIMGTENSVVTDTTTDVLLWIESVTPEKIRQASMGLSIRSQAAILNEKNVDSELAVPTIKRAVELFTKLTGGMVASSLTDIYPHQPQIKPITLTQERLESYLGVSLPVKRVETILKNLHFTVKTKTSASVQYVVTPPSWRTRDVTIAEDVIEEVARLFGYHNLKSLLPTTAIPHNPPPENFDLEYKLKTFLSGWGMTEVYTMSLVSETLAKESGFELQSHLSVKNPLSDDWVYLRRSLIPSLTQVLKDNQRDAIDIFELQNVYHPAYAKASTFAEASADRSAGKPASTRGESTRGGPSLPIEELHITLVSTQNYRHLKGIVDALLARLHLTNVTILPAKQAPRTFSLHQTGEITAQGKLLGFIGLITKSHAYAADLLVKPLLALSQTHPRYIPVVTTPPIIEDLTLDLPEKTSVGVVIETIRTLSPLIEHVTLKDIYKQSFTFTITYRDPQASLTDTQVAPLRQKIVSTLSSRFKAELKGKL